MAVFFRVALGVGLAAALSAASFANDVTYRKDIRPLLQQKCFGCHGAGSPYLGDFQENEKKFRAEMKGPRMDTYADLIFYVGWPDTGALMRRLDDGKSAKDGKPGNMYQFLGSTDGERQKNLELVKAWVGPGAWTTKRWKARGDVPGVTREELDRIKAKY
jgi:hypothetical protein